MLGSTTLGQRSFGSELRALLAMAHKEWTIFVRYPSWVIAFVIWPVLFPFGYIFTAKALSGPGGMAAATFGSRAGTTDYASFIVIGTTLYMWLNITLWDVGLQLREEQMRGTLESNWLCPIWRISLMLGGSLTKLATALMFLAITVVEFWLFFDIQLLRGNAALLLLLLLLLIASIYGIGIAFGSLVLRFKEANAMVFLVRGIFLVFCGTTYPIEVMPHWMQQIATLLPLTYANRALRMVILSQASFADVWPDVRALLIFAVMLPLLGYVAFRIVEQRARRTGTLGQY
ncbi:MAG TPA: ABC transporter permease [Roseiflexaceae bacterium]|nr:ABC transporter permease [Roseiflexaceae bacterium]